MVLHLCIILRYCISIGFLKKEVKRLFSDLYLRFRIVNAGIFRSLTIGIVNTEVRRVSALEGLAALGGTARMFLKTF